MDFGIAGRGFGLVPIVSAVSVGATEKARIEERANKRNNFCMGGLA